MTWEESTKTVSSRLPHVRGWIPQNLYFPSDGFGRWRRCIPNLSSSIWFLKLLLCNLSPTDSRFSYCLIRKCSVVAIKIKPNWSKFNCCANWKWSWLRLVVWWTGCSQQFTVHSTQFSRSVGRFCRFFSIEDWTRCATWLCSCLTWSDILSHPSLSRCIWKLSWWPHRLTILFTKIWKFKWYSHLCKWIFEQYKTIKTDFALSFWFLWLFDITIVWLEAPYLLLVHQLSR